MKHVKDIQIFEGRRDFRNYKHYNQFIKTKFYAREATVYKESDAIFILLQYSYSIGNRELSILYKTFGELPLRISEGNRRILVDINYIPDNMLEDFEMEMNAQKYNL